ncbi:MAG: carotenoid oxygenase family protein [Pseudomonadota bacterium]
MPLARPLEKSVSWLARQSQRLVGQSEAPNAFLEGPFAPVQEEVTATELTVRGSIPPELNGVLARIGPNPVAVGNTAVHHWFAGDGMVHGLRLREGRALWYRNRWVLSDNTADALGRDRLPGRRHGLPISVNTNVIGHAGKIWAMVESGPLPVELDPELNSVRQGLFHSDRRASFSAHPHLDPATGELHTVTYNALNPFRLEYKVIDPAGQLRRLVSIPVKHGPMVHDCAITRSQVVVLDLPVTFSTKAVLKGANVPYRWNHRHAARVGLLPREGSADAIRWYELEPCYVFHTCNAFDAPDGSVVVDVVAHDRMFVDSLQGPTQSRITFERWTLPAGGDRVQRQVLSTLPQEFPRFDERRATGPYRYAYTVASDLDRPDDNRLLYRHDLDTGELRQHDYGEGRVNAETIFVPRREEGAEDDGWLLSYVYDRHSDTSSVVILNADDLEGEPQAVIELPVRVPLGFHANWIADA